MTQQYPNYTNRHCVCRPACTRHVLASNSSVSTAATRTRTAAHSTVSRRVEFNLTLVVRHDIRVPSAILCRLDAAVEIGSAVGHSARRTTRAAAGFFARLVECISTCQFPIGDYTATTVGRRARRVEEIGRSSHELEPATARRLAPLVDTRHDSSLDAEREESGSRVASVERRR